jgi:NAD(P)-dependent dehydrogenase (short-subunit alcohol dehydrogenase family)
MAAVPRGPFGARATAAEVVRDRDLTGRTALVTGATSGIGLETVRVLAARGAHVIATGRTADKVARVTAGFGGRITPLACDHEDFVSVAACADTVKAMNVGLDMLIANAGILGAHRIELLHGVAKQFAVNHLSHFILVNRLRGALAPEGRIVMVSSNAHRRAPAAGIRFDNLAGERGYFAFTLYAQSKLANHLFARALARRLEGRTANSVHPGLVYTGIFRMLPALPREVLMLFGRPFMKSPEQGAATQVYVATSPLLAGVTGVYFADCNPQQPGRNMENDALAERLWAWSQERVRAYL